MSELEARKAEFCSLREEVYAYAEEGRKFAKPRQKLKQIERLAHDDWKIDWTETLIVFYCHRRDKPAKTHSLLNQLKELCEKQGQSARFVAFFEFVNTILHPDAITPHGYCTPFSQRPAEEIFASLQETLLPLFGFDYPVMLYAGALLGFIRDGALIAHDDDIDVAIYIGDYPRQDISRLWLEYRRGLAKSDLIAQDHLPSKSPIFKLKNSLGIDVDLFPCWTDKGRFSVFPYALEDLDEAEIFPMQPFLDTGLKIPGNPQALLRQSYGEDWRIPDPLFHFNWPGAKKRFGFLCNSDFSL